MKKLKIYSYIIALLMLGVSCEQELVDNSGSPCPSDDPSIICPQAEVDQCAGATAGSASFTKFVAIGNSFVAGVQAGALFTEGQNNSLPAILNKQFQCVGAPAEFKQPTINATLGWNLFITQPKLTDPTKPALGRMLLQNGTVPDCATGLISPRPTPQAYAATNVEAVPNPAANPGFIYTGGKATLNNFGVPAIVLGQSLIAETGAWAGASTDPRFNPFYGRLAYPGTGSSTIIGDVSASGGTFFLFWLGLDDFFLHAANGGDPAKAPLTATGSFNGQYAAAIGALMTNTTMKGVVGNFPNIFAMPHFTSVTYNPIPLDATTAAAVGAGFAGYNAALDGLIANAANFGINDNLKAEIATRKVTFSASCNNRILIQDETLTNLGPYFDGLKNAGAITTDQRNALIPYERVRQTTSTDIIPLSTGSILGTTVGGNPLLVNGVSVPLADQYVLIPTEIQQIEAARVAFNTTVANVVAANSARLALADVNAAMTSFVTARAAIANNITVTPNINPPTGIYSEDGAHPNSRGYAFIANVFIDAINAKFGSTVPKVNLTKYSATALPIP
jgi:hypothetical protein